MVAGKDMLEVGRFISRINHTDLSDLIHSCLLKVIDRAITSARFLVPRHIQVTGRQVFRGGEALVESL